MTTTQHAALEAQILLIRDNALANPTSENIGAYGRAIAGRWIATSVRRRGAAYWHAAALYPHAAAIQTKGV